MKKQYLVKLLALGVASLLTLSVAHAQIGTLTGGGLNGASIYEQDATTTTAQAFWANNFNTATDLLLGAAPISSTGSFNQQDPTGLVSITDGTLPIISNTSGSGPGTGDGYQDSLASTDAGYQIIYAFSTAENLSEVQLFGGWPNSGRGSFNLGSVQYSTNGGTSYTSLGGFAQTNTDGDANGWLLNIVPTTTTYFGNGAAITDLEFNFVTGPNGFQGLAQVTASGVAAVVPEPSTWALCLSGVLFLGYVLRRRRA
jgi:hypothetical protein